MSAPKAKRPRKWDRFTAPDASAGDTAAHYALAPYDEAVRQADKTWGVDRLPAIVSPETAAKWGTAMAQLNAAIETGDVDQITARVGVCLRGIDAMNAEAERTGKSKSNPEIIEFSDNEMFHFAILKDERDWPALKAQNPHIVYFTRPEVANAMKAYMNALPTLEAVKEHFPNAKITKLGPMPDDTDLL